MNIIKYRNWFFALSLLVIIPGILAYFAWGLKLGIDFQGGTLWEIKFVEKKVTPRDFSQFLKLNQVDFSSISSAGGNQNILFRISSSDENKIKVIKTNILKTYGKTQDISLVTVGPTISQELTQKAVYAVAVSILGIVAYITWAFRKVPKPTSSLAFGVCTIVALVHDVIVVVGIFAILGHFWHIEVDSLFITALLTVLGFSVHDTIVVFDRIRENLRKHSGMPFEKVVNFSVLQTLTRSLNTSLTVAFVLLALLLFGGESIHTFVLALLIGIISGTYSSIFNAAPLLVVWNKLHQTKTR